MRLQNFSKKKFPRVTVIVMNYNGIKFLNGCFSSLSRLNYPNIDVIMVDASSTDGSATFVSKKFPSVKILSFDSSLGVPICFNKAAEEVKTDLLVKADNDVIFDKNWLKEMVETIESDPKIGVVGSMILNYDGKSIQEFGSVIDRMGYMTGCIALEGDPGKLPKILEVFYVSGCSMLFRRKIFDKAGMFDEKFFIYKDDLDLCWRMKLLGYKTVTNLKSVICHASGVTQGGSATAIEVKPPSTTGRRRYLGEKNTLRMLLKNYSGFSLLKILPFYFLQLLSESIFFAFLGQFKLAKAYFNAILWNIQNFQDTLKERRKVQAIRAVSDRTIMQRMIKGSSRLRFFFKTFKIPQFD